MPIGVRPLRPFLAPCLTVGLLLAVHPLALAQAPRAAAADGPAATAPGAEKLREAIGGLGDSPVSAVLTELGADVQRYHQHVTTLSDPYFEGRAPGTEGNRRAAEYIEHYFRAAGLEPAFKATEGDDEEAAAGPSYRQPFRAGNEKRVVRQRLAFGEGAAMLVLEPGTDFNLLGSSGSGELEDAGVVFVGYGIEEGPEGYSSYADDTDLTGKIAMVMRFEPMDDEGKSRWAERGWSPNAGLDAKLSGAVERGAAAVLLVNPPGTDDPRARELMDLKSSLGASRALSVPVAMITPEAAERMLKAAGAGPLMELRKRADAEGGVTELEDLSVTMDAEVKRQPIMTDNVAGVLPGRGELKNEYIVIGGHYDHVGFGPVGVIDTSNMGKLHPGADDNASGTSGVLFLAENLARAYAELPEEADARSILFIAFTAEESGLNGSRWWVNHPSVPLADVDLMVNMDMIGRLREGKVEVDGVESAVGFYDWLKPFFDESGLTVAHGFKIPGNSDHYSFYAKKIPILSLFTGYHDVYHTPGDVAHLINPSGAVRVLNMVEAITLAAAQRPERLEFKPSRPPEREDGEPEPAASGAEG